MRTQGVAITLSLALAACSSVAYQKPVATFKGSLDAFTTAQAAYGAANGVAVGDANSARTDALLRAGEPLHVRLDCVGEADKALAAASSALSSGSSLDALYGPAGAMTSLKSCWADVIDPPADVGVAPPAGADAASSPGKSSWDQTAADAEAASDTATCNARRSFGAPPPPAAVPSLDTADLDTVWSAIGKYAAGLADISSADNSKSLSDATTGAASAIGKAGTALSKNSVFAPAVNLLFLVFDKAVEQKRYDVLKTSVICANPLFIRWRGTLRDAMRYEQISAFDNEAHAFSQDAQRVQAGFDPDPAPNRDCPPMVSDRSVRRGSAPSSASRSQTAGCLVAAARAIENDPASSAELLFSAESYLEGRAVRLRPILNKAQSDAAAASSLAKADPGPAVDAFVQAHRALRSAIVSNAGQLGALEASVNDLYTDAKALSDALKPAAAASKGTKGA